MPRDPCTLECVSNKQGQSPFYPQDNCHGQEGNTDTLPTMESADLIQALSVVPMMSFIEKDKKVKILLRLVITSLRSCFICDKPLSFLDFHDLDHLEDHRQVPPSGFIWCFLMIRFLLHILKLKQRLFSRRGCSVVPTFALSPIDDLNFDHSSEIVSARLLLFKIVPFPFVISIL